MPAISVIIPVFNTANYLEQAVRSICEQRFTDIEIIIINDGSTDNSLEIANTLASQDHRITIYSQQNKGLSEARNAGLQKAVSEYIYFMDSDDVLAPDALIRCHKKLTDEDLDVVFFNASIFYDDTNSTALPFNYERVPIDDTKVYKGREIMEFLIDHDCYRSSACLYVAKKRFIEHIGLSFFPGIIHEDELYSGLLFCQAERAGYINQPFFHRRVRGGSIMATKFSMRNIRGYFTVIQGLTKFSEHADIAEKQAIAKLIRYIINPVVYNASTMALQDRWGILKEIIRKNLLKALKPKNIFVLMFPQLITLKGTFKKLVGSIAER